MAEGGARKKLPVTTAQVLVQVRFRRGHGDVETAVQASLPDRPEQRPRHIL